MQDTWLAKSRDYGVTIQMKATEQYFSMMLFIIQNKVVLNW